MSAPTAPQVQQPAGIATASLVLGIAGFFVGVCSVIGLVLGLVASGKAKRGEISPARVKAGIVVSVVTLALQVLGAIVLVAIITAGSAGTTAGATSSLPAPLASTAPAPVASSDAAPAVEVAAPAAEAPASAAAQTPAPAAAPAAEVISDGDWTLDKVQFDGSSFGVTSGTARITNNGGAVSTASFSVAVEGSDGSIGTLTGIASDVTAGDTITVDLLGSDTVLDPAATDLKVASF